MDLQKMKNQIQELINEGQTNLAEMLIIGQQFHRSDFDWSLRSLALSFVERNGPSNWKKIQHYMLKLKGYRQTHETRGYYASYFKDYSSSMWGGHIECGILRRPSNRDGRWLDKREDGLYYLCGQK